MADVTIDGKEWTEVPAYSDPTDHEYLVQFDGFSNDVRMWFPKPTLPTESGIYVDREGDAWKYDAEDDIWYELAALLAGTYDSISAYNDPRDYLPLVKVA